jgi:predicted dehydrogenase
MVGGTKKMAVYDENTPADRIKIYDKGVSLKTSPTRQDFLVTYRVGDMSAPALPNHESLAEMVKGFLEYISGEKPCASDGTAGRRVVQILEAATLSVAQNGKPVDLAQFGITELPGRLAAM